jgi:hypothetical protein
MELKKSYSKVINGVTIESYYPIIESIDEVTEFGRTYTTLNFDIFKRMEHNRGEASGIEKNRVNTFKRLVEENRYYGNMTHTIVNMIFEMCDGTNREEMHKICNIPLNFLVTPEPDFNSPDIKVKLNAMSRINAVNQKWNGTANFKVATKCDAMLAMEIATLKAKFESVYHFKKNLLTPSRIYALLVKDSDGLNGKSREMSVYCDDSLVSKIKEEKFNTEFGFVCAVCDNMIKKSDITPFYVIRAIMPLIWDETVTMKAAYNAILNDDFKKVSNNSGSVKKYIHTLLNINPKKKLTSW